MSRTNLLQKINSNIFFYGMFIAIIISMIHHHFFEEKTISTDSDSKTLIDQFLQKHKINLIILVFVFILFCLWLFIRNFIEFKEETTNPQSHYIKVFTQKLITKEELQKNSEEATRRELKKLFENPQFQKMYEEKGDDMTNWNWQSRERAQKVVYRDNESCSDSELSKITLTD